MKRTIILTLLFCAISSAYSQFYNREILKKSECYQIGKNGKMCEMDSLVVQINNRNGERDIYITYSKGDKVSIGDIYIEDMQGNLIRKLKNKEIKNKNYNSESVFFGDGFVKYFTLRHSVYPYKLIYSYRISYKRSLGACGIDCRSEDSPIHKGSISVEIPLTDSIKHQEINVKTPLITKKENTQIYTWNYSFVPPRRKEQNSPISKGNEPIVRVVPLYFKYEVNGSFKNWQTYGNWVYRLNKGRDELPFSEQTKINTLIKNASSKKEKAKILYHYLQDYTRYINISFKQGGFQTYPASYVSENKYGDCKALTYYMQAMLKYINIPSYPVLVLAGENEPAIESDFAYPAFNHVILAIPFDNDTTFLECTAKKIPFGYLGTFTQNRKALFVDENNSHIIHLPTLNEKDVCCSTKYIIYPDQSKVKISATFRGKKYEYFNAMSTQISKNDLDYYIRNTIIPAATELQTYKFEKKGVEKNEIGLKASIRVENITQELGNNLRIMPFPIHLPLYESPQKRKTRVQLHYPESYADTIVYKFNDKITFRKPDDVTIASKFGHYSLIYKTKSDELICIKALSIYSGKYEITEYKDFYQFMQTVRKLENIAIYIETL